MEPSKSRPASGWLALNRWPQLTLTRRVRSGIAFYLQAEEGEIEILEEMANHLPVVDVDVTMSGLGVRFGLQPSGA